MADVVSALVALLKADAGVAALVGSGASARVFGGELPADETEHMPRHAIVLTPSGGISLTADSLARHDTGRLDAFAYGPTPQDAFELMTAAALAFRTAPRAVWEGVLIHWVRPAAAAASQRDAALAWPRTFQPFQVFHALEETN